MPAFGDYSRYYDLLYRDKDYAGEAAFVLRALKKQGCDPHSLLDLGCGSGRHALVWAAGGREVAGVDRSEAMLNLGREAMRGLAGPKPELIPGDIRDLRLNRVFDAAVALFHVMSYQTSEEDLLAALASVRRHLAPGGFFLFDFWHGPGVLREPPSERRKTLEDGERRLERLARPVLRLEDNLVEVHYTLRLREREGAEEEVVEETHLLRYWFVAELRRLAGAAGFSVAACGAWPDFAPPGLDSWHAWMALCAKR